MDEAGNCHTSSEQVDTGLGLRGQEKSNLTPVLNYGIEECRFLKPVYLGSTIQVRFTVKEKVDQEKRTQEDVAKGKACPGPRPGVKFLVDVFDETGETVAIATILTMVKKIDQSL
ncbi:MAG: hypothetical protein IPM12_09020 [Flavobacteriales bacterium]|nr:hypothetical protein [Flavobacteriales bacterium]